MKVESKKLDSLIPYGFNNRIHSDTQIERIARSIKEFGFNQPIVVDEDNVVLVGHGRLEAAKKLGLDTAPTVKISGLSEESKKAYRILDNKLQNDSEWNFHSLGLELEFLKENRFPIQEWGLDSLLNLFPEEEPEIYEDEGGGELPEETYLKLGDLIELGKHRVLCGDSTSAEDNQTLMTGELANLIFTDPPYNLGGNLKSGYEGTTAAKAQGELKNCGWDTDFNCIDYLKHIKTYLTPDNSIYICMSHFTAPEIWGWMKDNTDFYGFCVWCKTNPMPSLHKRHWTFGVELIAYATNGKHTFNFPQSGHALNWWDIKNGAHGFGHPTEKRLEVPAMAIKHSSHVGDVVLDSFLGSGTTLIAADQLNRICYGMEISPKYCQVILERYKKHCEKVGKPFECKINGLKYEPVAL